MSRSGLRFPVGTPYQGPLANYDDQVTPDQLLRRLVYSKPEPLLKDRQRMDTPFFGRLLDQLANAHAAFVKVCTNEGSARQVASHLRKELPDDLYEVGVRQDPDLPLDDEWMVIVYNRWTHSMAEPAWHDTLYPTSHWVDVREAARILHITTRQARRLAATVPHERTGGRNCIVFPREELVALANRPQRWKRRVRTYGRPLT